MQPNPRLIEKNDWPIALRIVAPVILLKSGRSRKPIPSRAPGSVRELMASAASRTIKTGMKILV